MGLTCYIQSRGAKVDQDYQWVQITNNGQQQCSDPAPPNLSNLLESESQSISIIRLENDTLFLQITDLPSSNRYDFAGRLVRNTITCISEPQYEDIIRGIAIRALNGQITDLLDTNIEFDTQFPSGFRINPLLVKELEQIKIEGNSEPNEERLIGQDSSNLRQNLANELTIYRLPSFIGPLVVVTRFIKPETLESARVWRAISAIVEGSIRRYTGGWYRYQEVSKKKLFRRA